MDEGMKTQSVLAEYDAEYREMYEALKEIAEIAEDHIDYDTADWHLALKLARQALGEGE